MDITSAFATIIGLLCNFKSEHHAKEKQTTKEFETWLREKNHSEVLDFILENHKIVVGLEKLLKKDSKSIYQIMSSLNDNMIMFSSKIDGLNDSYHLMSGGCINYDEPRFIEDDLKILVELELLNLETTSKGTRNFLFTRKANQLVENIYEKKC